MDSVNKLLCTIAETRVLAFVSAAAAGAVVAYFVTEAKKIQKQRRVPLLPTQRIVCEDKIVIVTGGSRGIGMYIPIEMRLLPSLCFR